MFRLYKTVPLVYQTLDNLAVVFASFHQKLLIPKNRIKYSPDCKNLKIYTKHCLIMSLGELSDYVSR